MNKHPKIVAAYSDGHINSYMSDRLVKATQFGTNDVLVDEMVQDAIDASSHGVQSDGDYNLYFFTKTCLPDMLKDTFGLNPKDCDQKSMQAYILSHKDNKDYNLKNLVDHRLLVHKFLCEQLDKRAYPNISGKQNQDETFDINKWVDTLRQIYASIHTKKMTRDAALNHFTVDWDSDEKQKFSTWMKYYESGTTEKYNVKNASTNLVKEALPGIPQAWINPADRAGDMSGMSTHRPIQKSDKELRQERAMQLKQQVQSRLRALRRLVDKYNEALPHQNLDAIYNEMNTLDRSVGRLNIYASIEDVIIRSANRMQKMGFADGAEFLNKIAAEPLVDNLPAPISPEPNLIPGSKPQVNISMIINRLEGVSKLLKSRDTIRELASIDILLNELGIASHFPELTDAQAKLIESFGYASNKIESIVAKLRGSGASRPSPAQSKQQAPAPMPMAGTVSTPPVAPKAEKVNTEELRTKPVSQVQQTLPKE